MTSILPSEAFRAAWNEAATMHDATLSAYAHAIRAAQARGDVAGWQRLAAARDEIRARGPTPRPRVFR